MRDCRLEEQPRLSTPANKVANFCTQARAQRIRFHGFVKFLDAGLVAVGRAQHLLHVRLEC